MSLSARRGQLRGYPAQFFQLKTKSMGQSENRAYPDPDRQPVPADRFKSSRRNATALMTVGPSSKLTRSYTGSEIRGDRLCR